MSVFEKFYNVSFTMFTRQCFSQDSCCPLDTRKKRLVIELMAVKSVRVRLYVLLRPEYFQTFILRVPDN
jgi:hypothetical protein